eukprot:Plantae.Rhodophyta-Rhodochaete_pulchella.ctg15179.p2 GENE.Plantae.Rhodophyta-Rhodochaete_pulchella.ctg15179~~Plantae.Rhodophyta-Rhodochaete_pulchella.ctg15179.p2  ORF type:complete len:163 (+),score=26.30 Plantae.Rhodophyta-Rhodochaete_pulchella.ctg15179:71-490(+)
MRTKGTPDLMRAVFDFAATMMGKLDPKDPSHHATKAILDRVIDMALPHVPATPDLTVPNRLAVVVFVVVCARLLQRRNAIEDGTSWVLRRGGIPAPQDMLLIAGLFLSVMYLVTFFGLQFVNPAAQPHVARRPPAAKDD